MHPLKVRRRRRPSPVPPHDLAHERVLAEDLVSEQLRVMRGSPIQVEDERPSIIEELSRELQSTREVVEKRSTRRPHVGERMLSRGHRVFPLRIERRVHVDERELRAYVPEKLLHAVEVVTLENERVVHAREDAASSSTTSPRASGSLALD